MKRLGCCLILTHDQFGMIPEVKVQVLTKQIKNRTDDVAGFHLMGIGHVFVDESLRFKNLLFNTHHDRMADWAIPKVHNGL